MSGVHPSEFFPQPSPVGRIPVYWCIARSVVQGWGNQRVLWMTVNLALVVAMACVVGAEVLQHTPHRWPLRFLGVQVLLTGAAMMITYGPWSLLVSALTQQNRADLARLVPGHVARLREVLVLCWLALMGLAFAVITWFKLDPIADFLLFALAAAFVAAAIRWPLLWAAVWLLPWAVVRLTDPLVSRTALVGAWWPLIPLAVAMLLALALSLLLQDGDAHHRRRDAQRLRLDARRGTHARPAGETTVWSSVGRTLSAPYHLWFKTVLSRRGRNVWPRLMLAFGPGVHGSVHAAWGLLLMLVAFTALAAVASLGLIPATGLRGPQLWGPMVGLLSIAINPVLGAAAALYRTRREQALLALLPGVPQGAALNRALAWRLLLRWCLAGGVGVAALGLLGHFAPAGQSTLAVVAICLLPTALLMCPDVSRLAAPASSPRTIVTVALLVSIPAVGLLAHHAAGLAVGAIAAAVVLPTAALLAWRWRALGRMPRAFPAGRFR